MRLDAAAVAAGLRENGEPRATAVTRRGAEFKVSHADRAPTFEPDF
jgi:hypothetical protein